MQSDDPRSTPAPGWTEGPYTLVGDDVIARDDERFLREGDMPRPIILADVDEDGAVSATERRANGHLFAASWDLAIALRDLLERYVGLINSGDAGFWDPEGEPEVIAARAALAKAAGKGERDGE